jgi:ATP phosphoribosyltransferase regulatory subunit HisZ
MTGEFTMIKIRPTTREETLTRAVDDLNLTETDLKTLTEILSKRRAKELVPINNLLGQLDDIAQDHDHVEYGLPMYCQTVMEEMQHAVQTFIKQQIEAHKRDDD